MSAKPFECLYPALEVNGGASVSVVEPNRRRRVRTVVHWKIRLLRSGAFEPVESVTQNLSSDGFYCLSATAFRRDEVLTCFILIPEHNPERAGRIVSLQCTVRVLRVDDLVVNGRHCGIACRIENYHFPRSGVAATPLGLSSRAGRPVEYQIPPDLPGGESL
jgi:hypothetical protein